MSFYVCQKDLCKLTGMSKQSINHARSKGQIPSEIGPNDDAIYDIDLPVIRAFIAKLPSGKSDLQKTAIEAYQKEFVRLRKAGKVACAMTGEFDLLGEMDEFSSAGFMEGEDLDTVKKQKDIEHTEEKIKKLRLTHEAMKGGLIERAYASAWIDRYIGTIHQQHLELCTTGIADDLYSAAHRIPDSRGAIKAMEKILADACSGILKGAIAAMEKNKL